MKVTPIAITQPLLQVDNKYISADELMAYIARVSNPKNKSNLSTMPKLLKYCASNKHWSVFEQADLTVEIITSRAIAQQILRHRSFCFQEFSQRYSKVLNNEEYEARRQDIKNRQNSVDDLPKYIQKWFQTAQQDVWNFADAIYHDALEKGIAKECARFILPLSTQTTLYMKGNVRSWIHYIELRTSNGTQKEHRDIAFEIKKIFMQYFPLTSQAVNWRI